MSNYIKQKQIQNLVDDLANKANAAVVLNKTNNLSDVSSISTARTNLDVHSKSEVNALISGASQARSVADLAARDALSGLAISDRIFVSDDGDGKWALYLVSSITDGNGSTSEYVKVADEDLFSNAMTASAIKTAYESNANTNEFSDTEKAKLGHISVTQAVDLDTMESDISTNATNVATAQATANSAVTAANAAQTTANSKEESFTETKETFTNMNVEPDIDNELVLANNVKAGFDVQVFFETLLLDNVAWTPGSNRVTINVPYITEETDKIHVIYKF
jgi:hypothetical protein